VGIHPVKGGALGTAVEDISNHHFALYRLFIRDISEGCT